MNSQAHSEVLTAPDVAKLLKVSRSHAYELMEKMPSFRLGRSIRIRREDLERWIEGRVNQ